VDVGRVEDVGQLIGGQTADVDKPGVQFRSQLRTLRRFQEFTSCPQFCIHTISMPSRRHDGANNYFQQWQCVLDDFLVCSIVESFTSVKQVVSYCVKKKQDLM